jgi:uncharacterized damage-inducible protein DinB
MFDILVAPTVSSRGDTFMMPAAPTLISIFEGWDSHQVALVRAISPLTPEQLTWRSSPQLRSVGEIISHIALGRLYWFHNMGAPGSAELARQIAPWEGEKTNTEELSEIRRWFDAIDQQETAIVENHTELLRWMEASWQMIVTTLSTWTVADLARTYRHLYQGKVYAVSRQWVIWRIMSHDLHHGGELSILLGLQGIDVPDLGDQGGHLTELPLAEPT